MDNRILLMCDDCKKNGKVEGCTMCSTYIHNPRFPTTRQRLDTKDKFINLICDNFDRSKDKFPNE